MLQPIQHEDLQIIDTLEDNQYLVQVRYGISTISKLLKNGNIPKDFQQNYADEYFILTESYREGWYIDDQVIDTQNHDWFFLISPDGLRVKIHSYKIASLLQNITVIDGAIQARCFFKAETKDLLVHL